MAYSSAKSPMGTKSRVPDFGPSAGGKASSYGGLESVEEGGLAPGLSKGETVLRWGFIRKVYGIVATQLLLTAVVCGIMMANRPLGLLFRTSPALHIAVTISSFICLFALYAYKDKHPTNLALLAVFTLLLSITVGSACSMYAPAVVLQALLLTGGVVGGLTAYTFWAVRKGQDFSHWGTYLFTGCWCLLLWGLLQMVFPMGEMTRTVYVLMGALLFSGYLIYDTHQLIAKHSIDEYIWASVELYLDMINLFLYILEILNRSQRN